MGRHKNGTQEAIMVHFMQLHSDLACGHVLNRDHRNALWIELANKLNNHGPPKKPAGRWKKVWFDWRSAVKRKILYDKNDAHVAELENIPYKKTLSPAEHDVALLCGFYETVTVENHDNYNADLQEDLTTQLSDSQEDLTTQLSDGSGGDYGDGVINIIKEEVIVSDEDDENPLACNIKTLVNVEEKNHGLNNDTQSKSNISERSVAQCEEATSANLRVVKVEVVEDNEANIATKKRKLNATNGAEIENVESMDLVQLLKQQTKVMNTVTMLINETTQMNQENLHILKDVRQGLKEMCASINQLNGATNENLKEQRRHNYEMEKLRREEILLQKQQLKLNEMKMFGKE